MELDSYSYLKRNINTITDLPTWLNPKPGGYGPKNFSSFPGERKSFRTPCREVWGHVPPENFENYCPEVGRKCISNILVNLLGRQSRGAGGFSPLVFAKFLQNLPCLKFWQFYASSPLTFQLAPADSNSLPRP